MIAIIFLLLFLALLIAWVGYRRSVFICFAIMLALATVVFVNDMTTNLTIQL